MHLSFRFVFRLKNNNYAKNRRALTFARVETRSDFISTRTETNKERVTQIKRKLKVRKKEIHKKKKKNKIN